jgi:hypothetical protein
MAIAPVSKSVSLVAAFAFSMGAVATAGCSGTDGVSAFPPAGDDAGSGTPNFDAGQLGQPDTGSSAVVDATCNPAQLATTFKPTWRPPNGLRSGACSAQQISDFYDACLATPVDPAKCAAFTQANGTCASCLQSDDSDPSYGPVIWHAKHAFYTLNVPGCIANEQNDTSPQSCGAAYQADLECKQTACTGCFAVPNSSFAAFSACEKSAANECTTYATGLHNACGDAIHDAGSPATTCLPPSTTPAKDVYKLYAPLFCGN